MNWSRCNDSDVASYEVYRSLNPGGSDRILIGTLPDANTTSFSDTTAPLVAAAYYQVVVVNTGGYRSGSNVATVEFPGGVLLTIQPRDVLLHPDLSRIYLYNEAGRIVVINYETQEILHDVSLGGPIGWVDIGDNGAGIELYVPTQSDGWIRIYSAETLTQTAMLNTGDPAYCAISDGRGHIYADLRPSPWWNWPVRSYSRSSLLPIDSAGRDFSTVFGGRIRMSRDTGELIEVSTGVSPADADYFAVDENAEFMIEEDDPYHGDHPLSAAIFRMSPAGDYWITSSQGAVYELNAGMGFVGTLPASAASFTDFGFSEDGTTIYAAIAGQPVIRTFSCPSLLEGPTIPLRGSALQMAVRGHEIICAIAAAGNLVGIDVVQVP